MSDAGADYCDIAASCLCGGAYVQAGNVPASGVLEATIATAYQGQVVATFGNVGTFVIGDVLCVNQSDVGATILVPIQTDSDASHVVTAPDGGTCVPNFAYTVLLDDAGRPSACNDGTESALPLTTTQAITALQATDCASSLGAIDPGWTQNECPAPGCSTSNGTLTTSVALTLALALIAARRTRRCTDS